MSRSFARARLLVVVLLATLLSSCVLYVPGVHVRSHVQPYYRYYEPPRVETRTYHWGLRYDYNRPSNREYRDNHRKWRRNQERYNDRWRYRYR